ncbi:GNAT family N-acetyltransferase [Ignisphaera sp. 4213-co]|uniref:GNAT family N-acetyltransferase n=1 Tax=Ignisphaera cupida TaxID=3050454 RepID=A0ABD4Z5C1_9CREN|nr:GNAT family N-acetyltransferase [Ignisphaera sp. 4213-co]MDK6028501.1 GNAT family N-acetyltransferase [Ignisphaera sp. 4213-co]
MFKVALYRDVRDEKLLDYVCRFHNKAFPFDNVDCGIFKSFIVDDANFDEELTLFIFDDFGNVRGFLAGVEIAKEPSEVVEKYRDVIWIKELVVDPDLSSDEWRGVLDKLLLEFELMSKGRGKKYVVLYAYAPYYFMPGINTLYENYLEFFESRGYSKKEETVNYEVNLAQFVYLKRVRKLESKLVSEGVKFRRGVENEAERVSHWVGKTFDSPFWRLESLYAFRNKPPSIWIAEQENELIGFSVYLRMGKNEFGPIGVDPSKRRLGVGTVLLFKALNDLKEMGFRHAVIPWTSHLFFYAQVPGIERVKHYYIMTKML